MKRTKIYTTLIGIILISNMALHAADYLSRAVVTDMKGDATYSSSMQDGKLIKGTALPQSYTLKTGKDSTVDLIVTSGVAIRLLPGTTVTIDTLDILSKGLPKSDSQSPLKRVVLNLRQGTILVNIPQGTKNIDLRVKTKFGVITADKPSVFEVSATSSAAEAKSGSGSFDVTTRNKTSTVPAGESIIMLQDEVQMLNNVSTKEILAFGTTSSEMLTSVFENANPENTQEVIEAIAGNTDTPSEQTPTSPPRRPRPSATPQPLPPEPIRESDPSPSTL